MSFFFTKFVKLDPHLFYLLDQDPHSKKTAGSGFAKNECGSTALLKFLVSSKNRDKNKILYN